MPGSHVGRLSVFPAEFRSQLVPRPIQIRGAKPEERRRPARCFSVLVALCRRGAGIVGDQRIQEANDFSLVAFLLRGGVYVFREVCEPGGQNFERNFTFYVSSVLRGIHHPAPFRLLESESLLSRAKR